MDFPDQNLFKSVMATFATGVTVVAIFAPEDQKLWGMTVNSFVSVSLSPPLVAYFLDRNSSRYSVFASAPDFCVNILSADQRDLSQKFASHNRAIWEDVPYFEEKGVPVLQGCLSYIVCEVVQRHHLGDHLMLVGAVKEMQKMKVDDPLIYFGHRYKNLV